MGLMYIFPVEEEQNGQVDDRVEVIDKTIILKTYGLPLVFWGYLAAILVVIISMWLASRAAVEKLIIYPDLSLQLLGYLVKYTLLFTPIILLGFYFYEKQIRKSKNTLYLVYRIFFITIAKNKLELDNFDAFTIDHYMDTPNMAKIYNQAELKHFENKGYFELHAICKGVPVLIDRHSRKADLTKLQALLSKY